VNELFRSDVFARAPVSGSEDVMREHFQGARFGTTVPLAQLCRSVKIAQYTLDFSGAIYDAILAVISKGAASARELAARPELAALGVKRLGEALMNLTLGGEVVPMGEGAKAEAPSERYRAPVAFNRAVLADESMQRPRVLASPVLGTGLAVTLLDVLLLQLLTSVEPARHASWIRAFAHRTKAPLAVGNKTVSDPAEMVRVVGRELEAYRARSVPKLVELGILEAV
jgi:hypothetical protein